MKERQPVNYIYFGILFAVLSILHIYHVLLIEQASPIHRFFYSIYALVQCAIEVGALMVLSHWLARGSVKIFNTLFIVLTFVLFLIHLIDFPLVRIMGISIWYAFDFIRDETFQNFKEMLMATHISIASWMMAGLAIVVIPLLGILFFKVTAKLAHKKPIYFSSSVIGLGFFCALFFLSMFDYKTHTIAASPNNGKFLQVLPWKSTFFSSTHPQITVGHLSPDLTEGEYQSELETIQITAAKKPNIFLFVAESLREDFVTPAVTPALHAFKSSNISFKHALSASNATHTSWFSIFHSAYPFYWGNRQPTEWQSGSMPLQILKKAGYQVHVYSASRLSFYQMGERLFGKDYRLADTRHFFGEDEEKENHEKDTACVEALINDIPSYKEGHVFVIFLESTHFGYSWPAQESIAIAPESLDYLNLTCFNDQAEAVKSRYRNSLHFIDKLFGQFTETLKQVPGGQEAVVVFTGDHGEEFFEEGRVFHASNLNNMQTHVPLYFRLGSTTLQEPRELSSHLDIFPTILEHVLGHQEFESWFDGESILHASKKNFVVSARYNANRSPFEFLIHNGKNQLVARFDNKRNIFKAKALEIISHRNEKGVCLETVPEQVQSDFKAVLEMLFK